MFLFLKNTESNRHILVKAHAHMICKDTYFSSTGTCTTTGIWSVIL